MTAIKIKILIVHVKETVSQKTLLILCYTRVPMLEFSSVYKIQQIIDSWKNVSRFERKENQNYGPSENKENKNYGWWNFESWRKKFWSNNLTWTDLYVVRNGTIMWNPGGLMCERRAPPWKNTKSVHVKQCLTDSSLAVQSTPVIWTLIIRNSPWYKGKSWSLVNFWSPALVIRKPN